MTRSVIGARVAVIFGIAAVVSQLAMSRSDGSPITAAAPPATQPGEQGRPRNIVIILSDDHRYDFMGFMPGAPDWLQTPAMDRMAAQGAHIRNAFVTTALCSPSRASILTGQYAHRHGVVDNTSPIPQGTVFFPQHLKRAGYRTAYVGKWHMGEDAESDRPRPEFDHWVSFRGQGTYTNSTLNVNGRRVQAPGYTTDVLTDYALDWLRQQPAPQGGTTQPFFLVLSHKAVSDNGFLLGEHGLIDKRNAYEESIRIPMLAYAPGWIAPGSVVTHMVRNIDIAPTILELAGARATGEMDGRSVLSALRPVPGAQQRAAEEMLYEYYWE